jgi:polysaccharide deacetylase family sporulation protein PdaB
MIAQSIVALTILTLVASSWVIWTIVSNQVLMVTGGANKRLPIYSVKTEEKKIAISLDAAWGAERTPKILSLLKQHNIKTTFFLVTFWVEKYPEVAAQIVKEGHEIGLHSSTHPDFRTLSKDQIREELSKNAEIIKKTTGFEPKLFRPPFGAYDTRVLEVVEDDLGYLTIQWSVDSLDWKDVSKEFIVQRITRLVHPGAIVLFHNNGKETLAALEVLLPQLIEDGYEIVPISELLIKGDYYIDHEGRQVPKPRSTSGPPTAEIRPPAITANQPG